MGTRKHNEKEYHNKVFAEGTRSVVSKYYAVTRKSTGFYRNYLETHCPNKTALEYGCGPESYAFVMARKGTKVIGIDISETAIEQVKELALKEEAGKNTTFFVMDAEALDFETAQFDLICGTGILHHLDLPKAYSELARTLKPDGSAIFIEPLGHNPFIRLYRWLTPKLRTADEHPLLMRDLQLCRQYFGAIETRHFHLFSLLTVPFRNLPGFEGLLTCFEKLDQFVFKLCPPLRRCSWMVILILSQPKPTRKFLPSEKVSGEGV